MEEENINSVEPENVEVSSTETNSEVNTPVEPSVSDETAGTPQKDLPETGTGAETKTNTLSDKTDLEKATFSFHKQFSKQKSKYEKMLAERDEQIKSFAERLERLENPDKYRPKYRDDFKTDDEFINHLVQKKFEEQWKSTLDAYEKEAKEKQEQEDLISSYKTRADESVKKFFPTEEAEKDYHEKIQDALEKGLGEVIDEDPDLAQYIIMSPNSAKIMYELATNIDAVRDLFENTTPMDKQFKIRALEQKLISTPAPVAPVVEAPVVEDKTKETPKPIGRPGVEKQSNGIDQIFNSSKSILEYLDKF